MTDSPRATGRGGDARHPALALAAVGCHTLGIWSVILLPLLAFSAKMTVLPRAELALEVAVHADCQHDVAHLRLARRRKRRREAGRAGAVSRAARRGHDGDLALQPLQVVADALRVGLGRIAVPETEAPNMFVKLL